MLYNTVGWSAQCVVCNRLQLYGVGVLFSSFAGKYGVVCVAWGGPLAQIMP